MVTGNIYVSNAIQTSNIIISKFANVATLNVSYGYISNIYTSNIVGFIGSQWVGQTGAPIYYVPNVGIGASTPPTANLMVTGNVYISNDISATNINLSGSAGIGTANPQYTLDTYGSSRYTFHDQTISISGPPEVGSNFGFASALSGDGKTVIIGANWANSGYGWAGVSRYTNGGWSAATLIDYNTPAYGQFGIAVALSADGNTALVGAFVVSWAGVYRYVDGAWGGPVQLVSTATDFGKAVSLSADGNTAIVGAPAHNSNSGYAAVFRCVNGVWSGPIVLTSTAGASAEFGNSVKLSGDGNTAIVGAHYKGTTDDGYAAVYRCVNGVWSGPVVLVSTSGPYGEFGSSVSLSYNGNTALVGAQADNSYIGYAAVFTYVGGVWSAATVLTNPVGGGGFGSSVSLNYDGTIVIVGAFVGAGYAGIFRYTNGVWGTVTPLTSGTTGSSAFGTSVSLSYDGTTALVGAPSTADGGYAAVYEVSSKFKVNDSLSVYNKTVLVSNLISSGQVTAPNFLIGTGTPAYSLDTYGSSRYTFHDQLTAAPLVSTAAGAARFGWSVATSLDGNTLLVGAYVGEYAAVYRYANGAWSSAASLSTAVTGRFGWSVSLSADGNTALVGAYTASTNVGYAAVYRYANGAWGSATPLTSTATGAAQFGYSVSLSSDGTTAIVGAPANNTNVGYAAIYRYTAAGTWSSAVALVSGAGAVGRFGWSVDLASNGNTAIVGAYSASSNSGYAAVYTYVGGAWSAAAPLTSTATGAAQFGYSVSLSNDGTTAIVGAPANSSNAGYAAVYRYANGAWGSATALTSTAGAGARFGWSVSLSADGNTALVGAYTASSSVGYAAIFLYTNSAWGSATPLTSTATGAAQFGYSVSLSNDGTTAIVGAPANSTNVGYAAVYGTGSKFIVNNTLSVYNKTVLASNLTTTGLTNIYNLQIAGASGTAGQVLTASGVGSGVQWGTGSAGTSQWTGVSGSSIYYVPLVGIGSTVAPTANLMVTGNIFASNAVSTSNLVVSTLANVATLNVASQANVATLNVATTTITGLTNLYNLQIAGVSGTAGQVIAATGVGSGITWAATSGGTSQWTGVAGNPIYYVPRVGIGSTLTPTANLMVTGNIYASNAVTTQNLTATNITDIYSLRIAGVAGTAGQVITASGSASGIQWGSGSTASSQWTTNVQNIYYKSGFVGIGTVSPAVSLDTFGSSKYTFHDKSAETILMASPSPVTDSAITPDGNTVILGAAGSDYAAVFRYTNGAWSTAEVLTKPGNYSGNSFGNAVALSADGNTALVGAWNYYPGPGMGQVYGWGWAGVYRYANGAWGSPTVFTNIAPSSSGRPHFGYAVALSADGNTALIGAPWAENPTVVSGWAAIYRYTNGSWGSAVQLVNAIGGSIEFGTSVALSYDGNTAIVGAPATSVTSTGYASVYRATGTTTWSTAVQLTSTAGTNSQFGTSVALNADASVAVVGAYLKGSAGAFAGYAAVFRYTTSWSSAVELPNPYTNSLFGQKVSISIRGTKVIVSSYSGVPILYNYLNGTWINSLALNNSTGSKWASLSGDGNTAVSGASIIDVDAKFNVNDTLTVYNNNVGIYTLVPTSNLHVTGNIFASNAVSTANLITTGLTNLAASLQIAGVSGTAGQVLTATGTGSGIQWATGGGGGSQWTGAAGNPIYYVPLVGIGSTATPTANLMVTGNIYASNALQTPNMIVSTLANIATLNVASQANIATLNVTSGYISNIYTSNIQGFIGSQWTGTTGNPIYYVPLVGIGSTATPTANLMVTGNIYASNALQTPGLVVSTLANLATLNVSTRANIFIMNSASETTGSMTVTGITNLGGGLQISGVAGNSGQVLTATGTGSGIQWATGGGGSSQWTGTAGNPIYYVPRVGIGSTLTPTANLMVTGNIYSSNALQTNDVVATGLTKTNNLTVTGSTNVAGVTGTGRLQVNYAQGSATPDVGIASFVNPNDAAGQDVSVNITIAGLNARYCYYSYLVAGQYGWSHGTSGSDPNFYFKRSYDFGSNTLYTLDPYGTFTAAGDITAYSDRRIKKDLKKIEGALDKVSKINGYTFTRTDEPLKDKRQAGVIAQEILEVLPEVVSVNNESGYYTVSYGNITALLIEALKEERQKREELEKRLARIEKMLL
jgi:hypothetical protein